MSTQDALNVFAERLGHRFGDAALLGRALCHRSWCAEHPGNDSNERLEFLGDAVLGVIVAEHVYHQFPDRDEGWLSRARSWVVRASTLADMAVELDLGEMVLLGKGEDASGGREKVSILADSLEAVIGAVYLDGGWDAARQVVLGMIAERLRAGDQDDKSRLQELVARRYDRPPAYRVDEHGPEHDKRFFARVLVDDRIVGEGPGRSKKQAEQVAARHAWRLLADEAVLDTVDAAAGDAAPIDPSPFTAPANGDGDGDGSPAAPPPTQPAGSGPDRTNETMDA